MLMTKGMPFCSATWAIALLCRNRRRPSGAARHRDQLLGARARDLDVGLGVGAHDFEFGQADALEDRVRQLDAAEAVLADPRLCAGRGSSTPTLSAAPCARTIAGAATMS